MPYEYEKAKYDLDLPSLANMTKKALEVLMQANEGFFLLVRKHVR